jgi:alkanesulfonate monooxygenase SsuD/methylene tetrahydromethanopterin reductase-like flavin-dependent oxidoreductase (luciferase family)
VKFGWFVYFQERDMPVAAMFQEYLSEIAYADQLGLDEIWLAEHHFSYYATLPSPNILLAGIASRTNRIRIGNMVTVLPLYDPLRLAEEVAMLDQLSDGRLNLGIGSGVVPEEFVRYGMPMEETKPRFHEALDVLLKAFTRERFDHEGRFYRYRDVALAPRPVQQPFPPLCQAVFSAESVRWCAERGIPIARIYDKFEDACAMAALYRDVAARGPARPITDSYPGGSPHLRGQPSIRHFRPVYVAETTEQAMAEAAPEFFRHFRRFAHEDDARDTPPSPEGFRRLVGKALKRLGPHDLDEMDAEELVLFGDPARVQRKLERLRDEAGMDGFVGIFAFGNLRHELVCRSLRLFASEVMPALRGATRPSPIVAAAPAGS